MKHTIHCHVYRKGKHVGYYFRKPMKPGRWFAVNAYGVRSARLRNHDECIQWLRENRKLKE